VALSAAGAMAGTPTFAREMEREFGQSCSANPIAAPQWKSRERYKGAFRGGGEMVGERLKSSLYLGVVRIVAWGVGPADWLVGASLTSGSECSGRHGW
jgi:hypothetical protein